MKETLAQTYSYLVTQIPKGDLPLHNAPGGSDFKGNTTLPFAYPANYRFWFNQTKIPDGYRFSPVDVVHAVTRVVGYIEKEEYEKMIGQLNYNQFKTPTEFYHDWNVAAFPFPVPLSVILFFLKLFFRFGHVMSGPWQYQL